MKNFKQLALGLLVGAMAIGFSSFTAQKSHVKKDDDSYSFVHVAHSTTNGRLDYKFRGTQAGCVESSNNCTSDWTQSSAPSEGDSPILGATQDDIQEGDYQGN